MTEDELLEDLFLIADRRKTEHVILNNLDKKWKYIARDKSGDLFLFKNRPVRKGDLWDTDADYFLFNCYNHLFEFITWEGPVYKLKEVLDEKS